MKADVEVQEKTEIIKAYTRKKELILTKEEHEQLLDAFRKGYESRFYDYYVSQKLLKELEPIRLMSIILRVQRAPYGNVDDEVIYFVKVEGEE